MATPITIAATATTAAVVALTFTTVDPIALVSALGLFAITLGGVIVKIILAMSARTAAAVAEVAAKIDKAAEKVDDVKVIAKATEGHVNSAASKSAEEIRGLRTEIAMLTTQLSEKKETAALLAQAVAITPAPVAGVPEGAGPAESLEEIEKHTAATATNTQRTEQKVTAIEEKTRDVP